jgi:hypothetical protein
MAREPRDATDDLRKQTLSQPAFGQLNNEVPGMLNEAPGGLEEPLLEASKGPAMDGEGQNRRRKRLPRL